MRWIYLAVIVLFALATLAFALQNLEVVTMSLLRFQVRAPLALVVANRVQADTVAELIALAHTMAPQKMNYASAGIGSVAHLAFEVFRDGAGIVPVGLAWNRAIDTGVADGNPYDGIEAGKVDLWAYDHYHASVYGYYLEALMDFGKITGHDPLDLEGKDRVAEALGISPQQAHALMQVAHDTLGA